MKIDAIIYSCNPKLLFNRQVAPDWGVFFSNTKVAVKGFGNIHSAPSTNSYCPEAPLKQYV